MPGTLFFFLFQHPQLRNSIFLQAIHSQMLRLMFVCLTDSRWLQEIHWLLLWASGSANFDFPANGSGEPKHEMFSLLALEETGSKGWAPSLTTNRKERWVHRQKAKMVIPQRTSQDLSSSMSSVLSVSGLWPSFVPCTEVSSSPTYNLWSVKHPQATGGSFWYLLTPKERHFSQEFSFMEALHSPWHCPNQLHPHPHLSDPLRSQRMAKPCPRCRFSLGCPWCPNDIFRVFCGKRTAPARSAKAVVVSLWVSEQLSFLGQGLGAAAPFSSALLPHRTQEFIHNPAGHCPGKSAPADSSWARAGLEHL